MSTYRPYPKTKPSGVEWLGDVPEHWVIMALRRCLIEHRQGYYTQSAYVDAGVKLLRITDLREYGQIDFSDCPRVEDLPELLPFLLKRSDFVFARTGGAGTFGLVPSIGEPVAYASYLIRFRFSKNADSNFLRYYFLSPSFQEPVKKSIHGGVNQNIHAEDIKDQLVNLPPLPEQHQIAAFLDRECGKLDALQAKQERLIELLKEKRQALISHAVTKGLNPNAKLKNSGIEWLGDVPEHWRVAGFTKFIISRVDYRGRTPEKTDSGVFLVTARNIKNGRIDYEAAQEYITEESYQEIMLRGKPEIGDVLFTTEAPLGEVAEVDRTDVGLAQRIIKFRGHSAHLRNDFLKYFILSEAFQQGLYSYASGSTALGIKAERFVYLRQLLPPLAEQRAIVAHLHEKCGKIDQLKTKAERGIELLKERRSALISAAVTGKIDVRDVPVAAVCNRQAQP